MRLRNALLVGLFALGGCRCAAWEWDAGTVPLDPDPTPTPVLGPCGDDLPDGVDPQLVGGTPDGVEVCNDRDDDCDGLVDELDPDLQGIEGPVDADGDGYGHPTQTVSSCEPALEDNTDCDDSDPAVHPGASEVWGDDVDQDCDGQPDPDPCEVEPPGAPYDADDQCFVEPPSGWFNPVVEWERPRSDSSVFGGSVSTPVVGHFTDDDGDGVLGSGGDVPDIAFTEIGNNHASLVLLSGDSGAEHASLPALDTALGPLWPSDQGDISVGDIDGDGAPEFVAFYELPTSPVSCGVGAQELDGSTLWAWTEQELECTDHAAHITDLTGDGTAEIVVGNRVLAGADGSLLWQGAGAEGWDTNYINSGFHSFAVDLDANGIEEVVVGGTVYDAGGSELCSSGLDGYPAVGDVDGDGAAEIVLTGGAVVTVLDGACGEQATWDLTDGGWGGPPTLADFDGDGLPEIGVASQNFYFVFEADGSEVWSNPVQDFSSSSTGSAGFDFDADGAAEAVYADETTLWIFDGATGSVLMQEDLRASTTRNEYPVVADVDGDGHAEIVTVNDSPSADSSLFVVGDSLDRWPNARSIWNQHAFAHGDASVDHAVAPPSPPSWQTWNSFRQNHATSPPVDPSSEPQPAPDLSLQVWGVCLDTGTFATAWVQVRNEGQEPVLGATVVSEYLYPGFSDPLQLDLREVDVAPGEVLTPFEVNFLVDAVQPTYFQAMVDPGDAVWECDESNNDAGLVHDPSLE